MIRKARSLGPPIPAELLAIPDALMPETDGQPMDSDWHRLCMCLLLEVVACRFQGRDDYYVSGNSCIYYSEEQVLKRDFLGPDFFFVKNVKRLPERTRWIVWREGMRFPDAIIELLSESTAKEDLGPKKRIYERVFKTAEYFCYDPDTEVLGGWRLDKKGNYQSLVTNDEGWVWSEQLEMWLGPGAANTWSTRPCGCASTIDTANSSLSPPKRPGKRQSRNGNAPKHNASGRRLNASGQTPNASGQRRLRRSSLV
jgi:Uma2 family endonuclease